MADKKSMTDNYASKAIFQLVESAGSTLTFDKLETGLSVYDKIGWVISRVETRLSAGTMALFNGTGDNLTVALVSTNSLTSLSDSNPAVYSLRNFVRIDFGTAASASITSGSFVDDYTGLPGGGLLVLPNPLYGGIVGSGLSGAASLNMTVFFQAVNLSDQDYFNLVQARQLLINS